MNRSCLAALAAVVLGGTQFIVSEAVAASAPLPPLPISRAPFERSDEVVRRPVSLATWPFHPQAGWTTLGEERLTTWAEFRSGDKLVVANGFDRRVHIVGRTGFGKLVFYRGGKESSEIPMKSEFYGHELLAWMELRVLDGSNPYSRYMECYSNATIKVDAEAKTVSWSRPCKGETARYSLVPDGDGKLALEWEAPSVPVEFRFYLCGNSTNRLHGVESGTRLYVNRNSETERIEIEFPEGKIVVTSAEELAKANYNNPVPCYVWRTDVASGRVMIDLCGSTIPNSSTPNTPTPTSGIIDFLETDAMDVPVDPTGNMLANGSFEQGLTGWNYWYNGVPWSVVAATGEPLESITDEAKVGDKALRMRSSKPHGTYEMLQSAPMSIEPGATHKLSAWVKRASGEQGEAKVALAASHVAQKFNLVTRQDRSEAKLVVPLSDDEWHFVEMPFVSECGDLKIVLSGSGAAVVVDGVRVERVASSDWINKIDRISESCKSCKSCLKKLVVEGRLETANPDNLLHFGEPINARLVLSGSDGAKGTVRVAVRNFYSETVYDKTLPFTLLKDKVLPLDFDPKKLGTGVFVLGAEFCLENNSGNYRTPYQRFAILKPLEGKHATADFFVQAPYYVKSSNGEKLGLYAKALGYTRTNWEANYRFADTNAPEALLRMRLGLKNRLHTVSTELNNKYPTRFGYGKKEGLNTFTNVVPEKVAFIEQEAYAAGMAAAPDDIYWALWNEEDAENREIRYAKTSEDRRKACEAWFAYQYACWKGLKKAFDERGLKLMYAPTHGICNYNDDEIGRETLGFYMDIAAQNGFHYDFIAIHTYGSIDRSYLGSADRDENTSVLLKRMAHYGYPETTPVMFSEGFNILPYTIPRWGATTSCDSYPHGGPASLDLGWREFLQAGAMARLYIMDLKYWPRVMNSHTWQYRLVADARMSPFMWNMVPNTLGHLLPSPKFLGDVKRDGWRAYVFRQGDYGVAAVWTNERQAELGRKKGMTLSVNLPEDVRFVDLMGNRRAAPSCDEGGAMAIPLTSAPLFIVSRDEEELLRSFDEVGGNGALVMSFDDRNFESWEKAAPLFRRYGAHATFFVFGTIDDNAKAVMARLAADGHSIGLHGLGHRNADSAVASMGAVEYWTKEIVPQLEACRAAGLNITSFAYPNCQFTGETDELFRTNGFKHVRGGLLDVTPYDPKGEKRAGLKPVHTVDAAFIPAKDLQNRFRLDTALVGESYNTDIEDILKCVRRCAERNEVFVLTSHGIAPGAKNINMKTEWLERILATAKECGVAVIGFDEL